MTWNEVVIALDEGKSIRMGYWPEGVYVTKENGVMTYHSPDGDLWDWVPSLSEKINDNWEVIS
ncbi:TPA: hypothetical protein U2M10_000711 [Klebsiella aerogenes]|uniref:hypothetical protein n=1 Tax=Klebsiella aerogenes TaxID=548 RepID=UPI000A9FE1C5|nr:hypothetical protein [Klebsiella aerogenes]HEM8068073.1 hypothetical protein [Klebsiella aerogenes]